MIFSEPSAVLIVTNKNNNCVKGERKMSEERKNPQYYLNYMVTTLKDNREWAMLRMPDLEGIYNVPLYIARNLLYCFRIIPNIRYEIMPVKTRFKPKRFLYTDIIANKVKDATEKHQFDIPENSEEYLRKQLNEYINEANIQRYYELGIVYERFIQDSAKSQWISPNLSRIGQLIMNQGNYIQSLIRTLENRQLVVRSSISNMYKVITCEEDRLENDDINLIEIPTEVDINLDIQSKAMQLWEKPLKYLTEVNNIKELTETIMALNGDMMQALDKYVIYCNKLSVKDEICGNQAAVFDALKTDYDAKLMELETAKASRIKAERNYKLIKEYNSQLLNKMQELHEEMLSQMVSSIENFAKLPPKEKLDLSTTNKLKNELINTVFSMNKEMANFKVTLKEEDL